MIKFHAVMLDETRCEFGTSIEANSHEEAYFALQELYPESQCVQLESPEDTRRRQDALYEQASREYDDHGYDPYWDEYNG